MKIKSFQIRFILSWTPKDIAIGFGVQTAFGLVIWFQIGPTSLNIELFSQ